VACQLENDDSIAPSGFMFTIAIRHSRKSRTSLTKLSLPGERSTFETIAPLNENSVGRVAEILTSAGTDIKSPLASLCRSVTRLAGSYCPNVMSPLLEAGAYLDRGLIGEFIEALDPRACVGQSRKFNRFCLGSR